MLPSNLIYFNIVHAIVYEYPFIPVIFLIHPHILPLLHYDISIYVILIHNYYCYFITISILLHMYNIFFATIFILYYYCVTITVLLLLFCYYCFVATVLLLMLCYYVTNKILMQYYDVITTNVINVITTM